MYCNCYSDNCFEASMGAEVDVELVENFYSAKRLDVTKFLTTFSVASRAG